MDLVDSVYSLARNFPSHEKYGLASQIQRAAVSVPSNIAEGHERHHLKEYLQHLSIALASMAELETQLESAFRLKYIPEDQLIARVSSWGLWGDNCAHCVSPLPSKHSSKGLLPST